MFKATDNFIEIVMDTNMKQEVKKIPFSFTQEVRSAIVTFYEE